MTPSETIEAEVLRYAEVTWADDDKVRFAVKR